MATSTGDFMSICPHCNGTGRDSARTARAIISGFIDKRSWVRCWNCHGNGNNPAADFYNNLKAQASRSTPVSTPK